MLSGHIEQAIVGREIREEAAPARSFKIEATVE